MSNYNNSYHSGIDAEPNNITDEAMDNQRLDNLMHNINIKQASGFKIGMRVRIRKVKKVFDKIQPNWSKTVYEIDHFEGNKVFVRNVDTDIVKDKGFSYNDLQVVDKVQVYDVPKGRERRQEEVVREHRVNRKMRKEDLDTNVIMTRKKLRSDTRETKIPSKLKDYVM